MLSSSSITMKTGPCLRFLLLWEILLVNILPTIAQQIHVTSPTIRSVQIFTGGEKRNVPCISLNGPNRLEVTFDDLTKEYRRFVYTVEHCNFQWEKNNRLFESDYLKGNLRRIPIEDYQESTNTSVEYTTYFMEFPTNQLDITISGNYRIRIYNDETKEEALSFCFLVIDEKIPVNVTATTNTEIDWNTCHQQLKISVPTNGITMFDTRKEIRIVVVQNGRWDKAVWNPTPDYITPTGVKWEHSKDLIFDAGNEFRKFEMTSTKIAMMGVENIKWFRPFYHATLYPNNVRKNYLYDEEQNGQYYTRTTDSGYDEDKGDYIWVHFLLKTEKASQKDMYVFGSLTNWAILPEAKLKYLPDCQMYEATMLLKEGYYNYIFACADNDSGQIDTHTLEGNFYQTENEYTILVYYTPRGGRYDQLIGYRNFKFHPDRQ